MVQALVIGIVIGGIYAICATGLVTTYTATGVLNFAYGSTAYAMARTYYFLHTQHGWAIAPAAILIILGIAPVLGAASYVLLFRYLRQADAFIKVIVTIGLSIVLPAACYLIYGNVTIDFAPGLAPQPEAYYHVFGVAIDLDQVIILGVVAAVLVSGGLMLRFSRAGLIVRGLVESPAMVELAGTNSSAASVGVWVVTTTLAALVGILIAPIIGLTSQSFAVLVSASFAALVVGRFTRLGTAIVAAFVVGIISEIAQQYLPTTSAWSADLVTAVPFVIMLGFLIFQMLKGEGAEDGSARGLLDRAITAPVSHESTMRHRRLAAGAAGELPHRSASTLLSRKTVLPTAFVAGVLVLSAVLDNFWVGIMANGVCFAVIFLSFTIATGEGGMIWLCQVTFGGLGAGFTALFASQHGWPVLGAVVVAALLVLPIGALVALITTRLGNLYVSLVTLAFGILVENVAFSLNIFSNQTLGWPIARPRFAGSNRVLVPVVLAVFCLVGLGVEHLRRSTAGLAVRAVRSGPTGAHVIGINSYLMKVVTGSIGAFVAAVGGGLLVVSIGVSNPSDTFDTIGGLVWLAVLVTVGSRSNSAALLAGLSFAVVPAIFQNYLPLSWIQVPTLAFGIGAVVVARNPDGQLAMHGRQLATATEWIRSRRLGRRPVASA